MSEAVIVALLSGGLTLLGTIITVLATHKSTLASLDKKTEVSDAQIKGQLDVIKADIRTLSNRVDKHNNVIERTYALEQKAAVFEEKMKVANHRIDDLEEGKTDDGH